MNAINFPSGDHDPLTPLKAWTMRKPDGPRSATNVNGAPSSVWETAFGVPAVATVIRTATTAVVSLPRLRTVALAVVHVFTRGLPTPLNEAKTRICHTRDNRA